MITEIAEMEGNYDVVPPPARSEVDIAIKILKKQQDRRQRRHSRRSLKAAVTLNDVFHS